jgi:hypothetical protein
MQAIKRQLLLKSSQLLLPASSRTFTALPSRFAPNMTTGTFEYIDRASFVDSQEPFVKPWAKVDGPGYNFRRTGIKRSVENLRGQESQFSVNTSGFAVYKSPANEKSFTDDQAVRKGYYEEVEQLLREKLPGVKKVVIFDHVSFDQVFEHSLYLTIHRLFDGKTNHHQDSQSSRFMLIKHQEQQKPESDAIYHKTKQKNF